MSETTNIPKEDGPTVGIDAIKSKEGSDNIPEQGLNNSKTEEHNIAAKIEPTAIKEGFYENDTTNIEQTLIKEGPGADNEELNKSQTSNKEEKKIEGKPRDLSSMLRALTFKGDVNLSPDDIETKALTQLRSMLENAILGNTLFKNTKETGKETGEASLLAKGGESSKEKIIQENNEIPTTEGEEAKKNEEPAVVIAKEEGAVQEKEVEVEIDIVTEEVDNDISLWGIPLLPSKGNKGTDTVLMKFLKANDFQVQESFQMIRKTLQWRKQFKMDTILDEDFGNHFSPVANMSGVDRQRHPVCYNVYDVFWTDEFFEKMFGTEEGRQKFLRWRIQLMEKGIQQLDFNPGGVTAFLQVNDLKNTPVPAKKELRNATKQAVEILQDNYPEFVETNIFINVPFWYYAFNALLYPFLTQRTKSKFVFARPSKVSETLLKYIPVEEIPAHYGGFKKENDSEFTSQDEVKEIIVKAGGSETIELPTPKEGITLVWDLTVVGWEVNYREEFVPEDEGSYTLIVNKSKKMGLNESAIGNSFTSREPGKVALIVENTSFKKKRILYRYKVKNTMESSSSSSSHS
ncbi:patellin-4-like [Impatiens glandulifera]|uniref:patellin-4-like n=1 Tax=Impatiens glandulifera TaxID=253017 RepID=UPI001FB15523|nr:patellin-4-like [Impatiens glandulifera]